MMIRRRRSLETVSMLALLVSLPGIAAAAEAERGASDGEGESAATEDDGAITVTGTRLQTSGFDAPTPVSVINEEQLQRAAPTRISDFVNQLPALAGSNTPRTNKGLIGNGIVGANLLNLRNLGVSRTLVLLNGKRVTPTTLTGAVDVNTLPTSLVNRVDVVTGGASAAWGSDAVAGVVNFVLDTKFEGLKMDAQAGISGEGDASNRSLGASFGTSFADGKGHVVFSGQYTRDGQALYASRKWFKGYKFVPNPLAGTAGQPTFVVAPWAAQLANNTGVVISGPLKGYYFGDDGSLAGTNFPTAGIAGNFYSGDKAVFDRLYDQSKFQQASIPSEQYTLFGHASYDFSDSVSLFAEASFADNKNRSRQANYTRVGANGITVARDNFYMPAAVRTAMVNANLTALPVNIFNSKLGYIDYGTHRKNYRGLIGLEGELGNGWKWDVYYQNGKLKSAIVADDMPIPGNYNLAIDVVDNPAKPGSPICRSTLTNPADGCLPLNPFGSVVPGDSVLAYVTGQSRQDLTYKQQVAAMNLSGSLFALPAGDVSFAIGAEYRKESAKAVADPISQASRFWAGNFKGFTGKFNAKEAYVELGVPVLQDSALGKSLDINLAGRITDYSVSGTVKTWKAGFSYAPVDGVDFRLTRSRDIRAPNLQELFQPGLVSNVAIFDPFRANENYRMFQTQSGNLDLKPEAADTLTFGVVLSPGFLPGFRASVDYYDIKIKGAIATNTSQFIINQCAAGIQLFCNAITRAAPIAPATVGLITAINLKPFNARSERAKGIDFEVSYTRPVGDSTLDFRVLANYVKTLSIDVLESPLPITRAGEVSNNTGAAEGVPHWRGTASVTYDSPGFVGQLKGRYIGSGIFDDVYTPAIVDRNSVGSVFYLDAYMAFKIGEERKSEFFLGVDNVFNKAPPIVSPNDNSNTVASGTNVFLYDVLGRYFKAGFRFKL